MMKKILTATVVALCAFSAVCQSVQLRDGSILIGQIEDAGGEGFTLRRTDNGGILKLRWSHLSESSAKAIRTAEGLLNTANVEVMVKADVLQYASSSGQIQEIVGRIVKEDDTSIYIRRGGDVTPIRRSDLRGKRTRQVTPFEIYTKPEYYALLLSETAPGADADKHLALGEKLMQVRDYSRAELHFREAKKLGGGRQSTVLDRRLKRLALLKGAADEQRLLDEIRTYTNRALFPQAKARIDEFKEKYPSSKLAGELAGLEKSFADARRTKLTRDTARLWYKAITAAANRKVADPEFNLAAAKTYGQRGMGQDIRASVAQQLKITPAEAEEMWGNRFAVTGAPANQHFHYSIGSWLLGEKDVLKDTKQGTTELAEAEKAKTDKEKEVQAGIKRIQDALRKARQARQRRTGNQGQGGKKEETPEDWWKNAERSQKVTWLKAYYAEQSGDMKLIGAYLTPCPNCGGTGRRVLQGSVGQAAQADCSVCHRTRYRRDIRVR